MVKVNTGMITGAIVTLVMAVVFLSMMPTLIPTATQAVHNLTDAISGGSNTSSSAYIIANANIGSGAASLASNIDNWTGYFWVVGPLVLVILIILGVFKMGRK